MKAYVRTVKGRTITACVQQLDCGTLLSITGGERSHIGAIAAVDEHGQQTITTFPGHKETILCQNWAETIYERTHEPVVVTAGIHYDNLSKEGIEEVLTASKELLHSVAMDLKN